MIKHGDVERLYLHSVTYLRASAVKPPLLDATVAAVEGRGGLSAACYPAHPNFMLDFMLGKILVVDDQLETRLAITTCLELSGYSVVTATDGREALAAVQTQPPDLIITDIIMPGLNGYELVKRMRQQPAFRLLPVIFLTGQNNTEARIQGYQSGADLYLAKPFDLSELLAVVNNCLERAQRLRQVGMTSPPATVVSSDNPKSLSGLTQREQEVLVLLTHGLSNAAIGTRLHLSPKTVEKYVSNLIRKTATRNRAELVGWFMKRHLREEN